jgi:hypothetical protein
MQALGQLDPEQKKTSDTIMAMFELAKKLKIRSATKLLQAARGKIDGASGKLAKAALEGVTSRQTMAPGARSTGKSAAEDMGKIFQSDLIDFSSNARSSDNKKKYALVVEDVFTREINTKAIDDKKPATVNKAFQDIVDIPDGPIKVTTDKGGEFSNLEAAMPDGKLIHVAKQANDKNAIAVIDVGIQQIKKDIAADIADEGGRWDSKLEGVTNAYNDRPHSATVVAPGEVSENKVAQFKLLQKNAANFVVNRSQTIAKQTQLREAGAFRVSEPNARSFNPQWSDKAFNLKHVKGDQVTNTSNKSFLLKHTQAVPKGSTEPLGRMTDPTLSRKARYQERANDVVEFLAERGSQMSLIEFEKAIRRNEAEGLIKVLRRNSMTIRSFIRIYPELFIVRNGTIKLRTQAAEPEPVAEPAPPPPPPPARRRITLVGGDDPQVQRNFAEALRQQGRLEEEAARRARARARVAGIREAYPG